MGIPEEKQTLRRTMRSMQRAIPQTERAVTDAAICENVLSSEAYRSAKTVFAYFGVDWEINTVPLLRQILADGKQLILPRCLPGRKMALKIVKALEDLEEDAFGIPAPTFEAPEITAAEIDLALIPCVAADRKGHRLGQGGGYYDIFLSSYDGTAFLLVRESAVLRDIPVEMHDRSLVFFATENGIFNIWGC